MDEFEIIRRYFARETYDESIRLGIGDDGAVLLPEAGRDLIVVVDALVAGVHFPLSLPAADIGYRAVAVNLSDIAAMGGRPRWMTLALTLVGADPEWLDGFADGLFEAADEHDVALVGGDTTHGSELVASVTIIGDVDAGKALTRSGAKPGDAIYVTGNPGDAAAGLSILQSGAPRNEDIDYLVGRFRRPVARISIGQSIASFATASIDLSDGLFTDLDKLLAASDLSGSIEIDAIPLSPVLGSIMSRDDAMRFALGGGDDYELCFTATSDDDCQQIAEESGVTITRIGEVGPGSGLTCTRGGEPYDYRDDGYRHFH